MAHLFASGPAEGWPWQRWPKTPHAGPTVLATRVWVALPIRGAECWVLRLLGSLRCGSPCRRSARCTAVQRCIRGSIGIAARRRTFVACCAWPRYTAGRQPKESESVGKDQDKETSGLTCGRHTFLTQFRRKTSCRGTSSGKTLIRLFAAQRPNPPAMASQNGEFVVQTTALHPRSSFSWWNMPVGPPAPNLSTASETYCDGMLPPAWRCFMVLRSGSPWGFDPASGNVPWGKGFAPCPCSVDLFRATYQYVWSHG